MKNATIVLLLLGLLVLAGAGYWAWSRGSAPANVPEQPAQATSTTTASADEPVATVTYACDADKSIHAVFYNGPTLPPVTRGGPPRPGGHVDLTLSDGRHLILAQTISADGIRYSDGDPSVPGGESIVFWSKGDTALVLEHNTDQTYKGCTEVSSVHPDQPQGQ